MSVTLTALPTIPHAAPPVPSPPHPVAGLPRETAVLALTLWGEAAERPVRAIEALAALVVNRARAAARPDGPAHWGRGIAGVCQAPFQFPCWNRHRPRLAALRAIPPGDPGLAMCRRIAARAVAGSLPDPTGGATRWHDGAHLPAWAVGQVPSAELGGLVFYGPPA